jgi:hypothetical protein
MDRILDLQTLLPDLQTTVAAGSGVSICCAGCASAISNNCHTNLYDPQDLGQFG